MDEKETQVSNLQQSQSNSLSSGQKTIQTSATSVAEIKAAQEESKQTAAANPSPVARPATINVATAPASSIYPEATHDVGTSIINTESKSNNISENLVTKNSSKILMVKIFAILLILFNLSNAYSWYLEKKAGYTSWTDLIGICLGILLTLGIYKLNEAARAAYVFLSIVLLALAGISYLSFYMSTRHTSSIQSNSTSQTRQVLEQGLANAKRNPTLSPEQRQKDINQTQDEINALSGSPVDLKAKQYISDTLLVIVAIGPLVFLTRPSIKEVFE